MSATQLLAHFDRLTEAPNSVPRLRRFILDLAVRGKLVEQDAEDESTTELLKRIQAARIKLVKAGKFKEGKAPGNILGDLPANQLPVNWNWVPFGATVNAHLGGGTPSKANLTYWNGDVLWASVKDVGKTKYLDSTIDRITEAGLADSSSNLIEPGNLIVVTRMGLGKVSINRVPVAINQDLRALSLSSLMSIDYCYIFLKTHGFEGSGLTVKGIKIEELLGIAFPLPPLAEQHRIVAKVDELMALCDQLEAAQQERERCRDRLAAASLQRLNQPAVDTTPEAQREHARFHLQHLPSLTTRPEHIKVMRQSILNLAVRGGLVRQPAGEDSAIGLLSAIAAAKSRLAKSGEIRKVVDLGPLTLEDAVFQVPDGWAWERLGTVGYTQTGTTPPTSMPECFGGNTPFVTPSDLTASVTTYDGKGLTEIGVKHSRLIAKNSVLMVCIGSTIGKVNVVDREICCNQQINTLTPVIDGMTGYLAIVLRSNYFQELVIANAGMGTLPILSKGKWELLPVPIPPLAEQHRIVAKVDELMALCDQLEAQLTTTQTDSRRLLEAVLKAALAPA